jgi:hypothetical protein
MGKRWRDPRFWFAPAIAVLYLALALPLLRSHGVTYDAPALYYAGDRTLFFLTHPRVPGALNFSLKEEPSGFRSFFSRDDEWQDPMRYPVFPALVAAVVSAIVHGGLGWLDPAAAHHLGLVLLNALALALFAHHAVRLLGTWAGLAAALALALFPCAFGHSFNNPKDWPAAMFYGVTVLAAGDGFLNGRPRALIAAGFYGGLSLASKLNGVFAFLTIAAWLPVAYFAFLRKVPRDVRRALLSASWRAPVIALLVFFLSWPWLWSGTPAAVVERLWTYLSFMAGYGVGQRTTWTLQPLTCVLFMTPPAILACALAGALSWIPRSSVPERLRLLLVGVWLLLPILRSVIPRSNFYDANRHFIEYIPALCALAGLGFAWTIALLVRAWARLPVQPGGAVGRIVATGLLSAGSAGSVLWALLAYAPFETAYFNAFVGGLGGAQRRALFMPSPGADPRSAGTEGDYWYHSLRLAFIEAGRRSNGPADIALCSAPVVLAEANRTGQPLRPVGVYSLNAQYAPLVWVSPREGACSWRMVRKLESERPVLLRVERGGGLIYELLGPRSFVPLTPVSPENRYTIVPGLM